jgi:hypothetical protein
MCVYIYLHMHMQSCKIVYTIFHLTKKETNIVEYKYKFGKWEYQAF